MTSYPPALRGLSDLSARYPAILSDVWGVLHNGVTRHEGAGEALQRYREGGGRVVLITNAPRPFGAVVDRLDELGVSRDAYDGVISSGDTTRSLLEGYRGRVVHAVGPDYDDVLFDGLGLQFGPAETAEAIVVTDLDGERETPADYAGRMALWHRRGLPLICANPDKVVEQGDSIVYCGGALADAYEDIGGRVLMAGKPFDPIYRQARTMLEEAASRRFRPEEILAIGDSVRTDAVGAAQFGIDLLFITGSIHAHELDAFNDPDPKRVADLVSSSRANMVGFMPRLVW